MATKSMISDDPWHTLAEQWDHFQPPLRPVRDDTAVVERIAADIAKMRGSLDVVMLGVTRETARCAWPKGARLRAFDSSEASINRVWPAGEVPPGATATCADWSMLSVEAGTIDLVTADGSLGCLDFPRGAGRVLAEVRRILRLGGRFITRTFQRKPETVEAVLSDLEAGRIDNPTVLKMRICGTMHVNGWAGFLAHDYWKVWQRLFPDQPAVAKRHGWPARSLTMLSSYENEDLRFVYPTMSELESVLAPNFRTVEVSYPSYELGELCPTLVLEPR